MSGTPDPLTTIPNTAVASWLGVMGGGQLGQMFAQAAQAMGYRVAVLEPNPDCPAGRVADRQVCAAYADVSALAELTAQCVAITTEFENVPAPSLALLAEQRFVAPSAAAVSIAQDRLLEKQFFADCAARSGVLPAPHQAITSAVEIDALPDDLLPGILKTVRLGYDGKGQVRVQSRDQLRAAFAELRQVDCVLEKMLSLAYEISVLVARGADGQTVVYPPSENVHRDGILFTSTVPGPNIDVDCAAKAQAAAQVIIAQLAYVGVLCIEFFVLQDGSLVVNEMAPRPHNSGHYTIDACVSSQFEQQVRALARLPLGDPRQHSPAVMLNILGEVWFDAEQRIWREPAWDAVLRLPGAKLHLYGKSEPRRGRKMGHITFIAPDLATAQNNVRRACEILGIVV